MKHFITRFLHSWPQKIISIFLAVIVWVIVDQSMTVTRSYQGVNVRVINIPENMSIPGIQPNGIYRKVALEITGKQSLMRHLNSSDLEIVIDASRKKGVWVQAVLKDNLISVNPEIDIKSGIKKVESLPPYIQISLEKIATANVRVRLSLPKGRAPKEFKFLQIYPKYTSLAISGPQKIINRLKEEGLNLRINLDDIKPVEWEPLFKQDHENNNKVVCFSPPRELLKISIPEISSTPFYLRDNEAKKIRLDFLKYDYHPIGYPIPVSIYFSPRFSHHVKPGSISILGSAVQKFNGVPVLKDQIYARGVSDCFLETIKNNIQCVIDLPHDINYQKIKWNISIGNLHDLEKRYVDYLIRNTQLTNSNRKLIEIEKQIHRNRFRFFLTSIKFFNKEHQPLSFDFKFERNKIFVDYVNAP